MPGQEVVSPAVIAPGSTGLVILYIFIIQIKYTPTIDSVPAYPKGQPVSVPIIINVIHTAATRNDYPIQ